MEVEIVFDMGPERILPNSEDELGHERPTDGGGVPEVGGEWNVEDMEEDEIEGEVEGEDGNGGYYYQPLNQDPDVLNSVPLDHGDENVPHVEQLQEVQERIEAMGLHLPQAPSSAIDEEDDPEFAAAQLSNASIPMNADHVELVKRTMSAVALPSLGIPAWAQEISEDQWKEMVQQTLETRQSSSALRLQRK